MSLNEAKSVDSPNNSEDILTNCENVVVNKNILFSLGLCKKASKLITGFDAVVREMSGEKSKIFGILVAGDISAKTLKEIRFEADKRGRPVTVLKAAMNEIEGVLKKRAGIIGILDEGLYKLF